MTLNDCAQLANVIFSLGFDGNPDTVTTYYIDNIGPLFTGKRGEFFNISPKIQPIAHRSTSGPVVKKVFELTWHFLIEMKLAIVARTIEQFRCSVPP
jgi:hypothetical protein